MPMDNAKSNSDTEVDDVLRHRQKATVLSDRLSTPNSTCADTQAKKELGNMCSPSLKCLDKDLTALLDFTARLMEAVDEYMEEIVQEHKKLITRLEEKEQDPVARDLERQQVEVTMVITMTSLGNTLQVGKREMGECEIDMGRCEECDGEEDEEEEDEEDEDDDEGDDEDEDEEE